MGKNRLCAAAKKVRFAAKSKNLEFLVENANLKAQPNTVGKREVDQQQPGTSNQKHRKAKLAHSAGQKVSNASCSSSINNPEPDKRTTVNALNPAATVSIGQLGNQQPGTSYQKQTQKEKKTRSEGKLTHLEGPKTASPSSCSRPKNSKPANKNTMNALHPAATDSTIRDEPQIDVLVNTSRHQVGEVVMDILMDWSDLETEENNDTVDAGVYEPPKGIGKTYTREKSGSQNLTEHRLDSVPQQIDLVTSNAVVCVCGQQGKIDELIKRNKDQEAQIEKLTLKSEESNRRCLRLTDALNAKVLGNPHTDVFTVIEGFASKEKLKIFSEAGQKSDYVFVKLLMHDLWPMGFSNRSVTGRSSNNPRGRNGATRTGLADTIVDGPPKIPLEPNKVSYIEDRLEEHRLYQGDSGAEARVKAKECGRLMTRVIAYYGKKDGIPAD